MVTKLDLKQQLKPLYQPSAKQVTLIKVPRFNFAMIDGRIEPGQAPGTSPAFAAAVGALYSVAYTLKFMSKLRATDPIDYPVMALEGLWWVTDSHFDLAQPDNWHWRAMILQPAHITQKLFKEAVKKVSAKAPAPAVDQLRLEPYTEGLCVQTLHIGPYAAEPATVARLRAFAAEHGYTDRHGQALRQGRLVVHDHHEIYLSDPRRAQSVKLRTVVRHPVQKMG